MGACHCAHVYLAVCAWSVDELVAGECDPYSSVGYAGSAVACVVASFALDVSHSVGCCTAVDAEFVLGYDGVLVAA